MRIKFSQEADQAFQSIVTDVLTVNPFVEMDNSRWLSAIVAVFHRSSSSKMREELVEALSTPESMRRALLKQIEQASLGMDSQAIRQLESNIRKLSTQIKKSEVIENETENH